MKGLSGAYQGNKVRGTLAKGFKATKIKRAANAPMGRSLSGKGSKGPTLTEKRSWLTKGKGW